MTLTATPSSDLNSILLSADILFVREYPFTDIIQGKFYYNAVLWAVEAEVTNGMTQTIFAPNNSCTRGQIVTFL